MLSLSNRDNSAGQDSDRVTEQQSAVFIVAVIICSLFIYFKLGLYECRSFCTVVIFFFYDLYKIITLKLSQGNLEIALAP
jgi:hypothetical protein